jgi:hypothetical protein
MIQVHLPPGATASIRRQSYFSKPPELYISQSSDFCQPYDSAHNYKLSDPIHGGADPEERASRYLIITSEAGFRIVIGLGALHGSRTAMSLTPIAWRYAFPGAKGTTKRVRVFKAKQIGGLIQLQHRVG